MALFKAEKKQLTKNAGKWQLVISEDMCKACGFCLNVCPVDVFAWRKDPNKLGWVPMFVATEANCVGCMLCFQVCLDFCIDVSGTVVGDGDAASIGTSHLIHPARRNLGVTVIWEDNMGYESTGGRFSPTTPAGYVTDSGPYGIDDPYRGEVVKACVVLKEERRNRVDQAKLSGFCRERLMPYKVPRLIEFRDDLPVSAAGKMLRRLLRDVAA